MRRQISATPVPWRVGELVRLWLATTTGAALIVCSWYLAGGTSRLSTQVAWANVGVLGVAVIGIANTLWLMAGRRAVTIRSRDLQERVDRLLERGATIRTDRLADASELLFTSARMSHFHRPGCPLAVGKKLDAARRSALEADSRTPCDVCRP